MGQALRSLGQHLFLPVCLGHRLYPASVLPLEYQEYLPSASFLPEPGGGFDPVREADLCWDVEGEQKQHPSPSTFRAASAAVRLDSSRVPSLCFYSAAPTCLPLGTGRKLPSGF